MHDSVTSHPWTVAVIGSGPAGCFTAQFLSKALPAAEVTVIEALPTPYGLIRYGVAADHQGTKAIARQFDRLFTRQGVRFVGNVCVGRDVGFDEIAANFDIVVLATGLPCDRELDVPRDREARVIGAGTLLKALNGHPDHALPRDSDGRLSTLGERLVVVGIGNVAVDVLRLLSKDAESLAGSDIDDAVLSALRPRPPRRIDVIARCEPAEAKCDTAMLRELTRLPNLDITVAGLRRTCGGPIVDLLEPYAGTTAPPAPGSGHTALAFHFGLTPRRITYDGRVTTLRASRALAPADQVSFHADTLITAIGFTRAPAGDLTRPSEDWAGVNVYRIGWLSSGGRGAIPSNRTSAQELVASIVADCREGRLRPGHPGFAPLEAALSERAVSFEDWRRIDSHERESAPSGRCRRKLTDLEQMLAIASDRSSGAADKDKAFA